MVVVVAVVVDVAKFLASRRASIASIASKIFPKSGVPNPVDASQPATASNPCFHMHPFSVHRLVPTVMSWKAVPFVSSYTWYNNGLAKPSAGRPAFLRCSLISPKIAPITGVDADVPLDNRGGRRRPARPACLIVQLDEIVVPSALRDATTQVVKS